MLHALISTIGILITIFFVVGTHEAAHFFTARGLGVKVLRFSIGFGKTLFRWSDKSGTEYVIALIPLGGYVKMLDEREGDVPENELSYAYNRQPFYKKFLIVLAGPLSNLVCAFFLYWIILMIGFTTFKPIIGDVTPNSIAAQAGLQPKQEIIRINEDETLSWARVVFRFVTFLGDQAYVEVTTKNPNNTESTHVLNLNNWKVDALSPDPIGSLGIVPAQPVIPLTIGTIAKNSPASAAGLEKGDLLISLNGEKIKDWEMLFIYIYEHPHDTITLDILRNKKPMQIKAVIGYKRTFTMQKTGYLGISPPYIKLPPELLRKIQYGPIAAMPHALNEVVDFTYFNVLLFGKLITGKMSLQSLGGPIMIFEGAGDALNSGFVAFLGFLAFLSIAIGVINFFPIPGLDGGHMLMQIIEAIIRRPLPERVVNLMYQFGFLLIIFILIQAVTNDILRLV